MERIDLAIVVLAVVAVGGSVAGLLTYEGGGLNTYVMNFEAHELEPDPQNDQVTGSGDAEFTFTVDRANITEVTVETVVGTSDPVLTARDVQVTVESPNGSTGSDNGEIGSDVGGGSVTLTTTVAVSEVPADHEEQATSAEAVRRQAIRDHSHTMETGDWMVTVEISGGSSQDPATFDVDARLTVGYFDVHIQQQTPDVER